MSTPNIPGFIEQFREESLASIWTIPSGLGDVNLWPESLMKTVKRNPTGWLTVIMHERNEQGSLGIGCVLVNKTQESDAINEAKWVGTRLGDVSVWESPQGEHGFENGLTLDERGLRLEFFAHVRRPAGGETPIAEILPSFLWFWDAFSVPGGWNYLSASGREHELVKFKIDDRGWRVEVRVDELRTYLKESGLSAVVQIDAISRGSEVEYDRIADQCVTDWLNFEFAAVGDSRAINDWESYSRLLGQYVLTGRQTTRRPRWESEDDEIPYPEFIYAIDEATGEQLMHTCDPRELGSYFDEDSSRLHFLTPIYFNREVLVPYANQPNKYALSATRLACLNLWGVDISINSAGLVEVYLGDIGERIPSDDWGHWKSYNVPPEGTMEEGRFRRDFLAQFAPTPSRVEEMREAQKQANATSERVLGFRLWRVLPHELDAQFRSLIPPLSDDPTSIETPVLVLAKVFIDSLNVKSMKNFVGKGHKDEKSLSILRRLFEKLGDERDLSRVFRNLYAFRSRGGVAHISNSESEKARTELGIDGLRPRDAFNHLVGEISEGVKGITSLLESREKEPEIQLKPNEDEI